MSIKKEPSYWTEQKVLLTKRMLNQTVPTNRNDANTPLF